MDEVAPGAERTASAHFSPSTNADQDAAATNTTGPSGTLLSRTGTTPGNPSATSTQSPPS